MANRARNRHLAAKTQFYSHFAAFHRDSYGSLAHRKAHDEPLWTLDLRLRRNGYCYRNWLF
jgi:hypothetical protein